MPVKPTLANVDQLQHNAVARLTLHVAAASMGKFAKLQEWLLARVNAAADEEGNADPAKLGMVATEFGPKWKAAIGQYTALLSRARVQAADIAYTPLRLRHNTYITATTTQEATTPTEAIVEMWIRRRNMALAAAQRRTYSDGLVLSQRIWNLENDGLSRIRATLAAGMDGRTSAVRLSRQLEQALGANQDMPRWAYSRLNKMTAAERANDLTGLLTDPAQRSQGMAYNALRMARTELQYANHAVTTEIAAHSPWITGRYVRLSPAHPQSDICDEWAAGGPYDKNLNVLLLHPNCLCRYEEALMQPSAFAAQVAGWVRGDNDFLDDYSDWLGQRSITPLPDFGTIAAVMDLWLNGSVDAQAEALQL
jgi:hypothetical protein